MKNAEPRNQKGHGQLNPEDVAKYWDKQDTSELLESGEPESLEIEEVSYRCANCGSGRIRRRMIDLPIFAGKLVLNKVKVCYCTDCKTSVIEKVSFHELRETLKCIAKDAIDIDEVLKEALASYERRWKKRFKERKVISIYFPTREGSPAKAHISIMSSDPLYPKIRSLSSEAVRSLLALEFYEDLENEALKQHRSISQYLKLALGEKLPSVSDGNSNEKAMSSVDPSIVLTPRRVKGNQFRKDFPHARALELAAQSIEEEVLVFQSSDRRFIGVLDYDYEKALLFLEIEKDDLGLRLAEVELVMENDQRIARQGLAVKNRRILLLSNTANIEKDLTQIILKQKS